MQKITPFLWFNNNAEDAVNFYTSVFPNSKILSTTRYDKAAANVSGMPKGSIMTASFELAAQKFTALNGGPVFRFTPAISFFVYCETESEVQELWDKLSDGGKALMPLDKYPFSEKYGWIEDKFGLSWQLILLQTNVEQKIVPSLMFTGDVAGKAEEAINFYTSIFKDSKTGDIFRYGPNEGPDKEENITHAAFTLEGRLFAAMDSAHEHNFNFTEAQSFFVNCESQKEVDYYWEKLSAVPESEQCGWLKDKYGVSWQIVPSILFKLLSDPNPGKAQRVTQAMLNMKKINIDELNKAYNAE